MLEILFSEHVSNFMVTSEHVRNFISEHVRRLGIDTRLNLPEDSKLTTSSKCQHF
jgi:hypothetical protein